MELLANNLVVDLGGVRVLHDVSVQLSNGEVVGVVGPNGAGKTTLMRALAGLQKLAAGEVLIDEVRLADWQPKRLARAIGYLPQAAAFHWPISVERAVALGRFPHHPGYYQKSSADEHAIAFAMDRVGIGHLRSRRVDQISGGECMRVHLARLLAGDHAIIVADEPIVSLDTKLQLQLMNVFKDLAALGKGVILSVHDLSLAVRFCDRLIVLDDGRRVADDSPRAALSDEILARVFQVSVERVESSTGLSIIPVEALPQREPNFAVSRSTTPRPKVSS